MKIRIIVEEQLYRPEEKLSHEVELDPDTFRESSEMAAHAIRQTIHSLGQKLRKRHYERLKEARSLKPPQAMSDLRQCPHCQGSLERYEDPLAVEIIKRHEATAAALAAKWAAQASELRFHSHLDPSRQRVRQLEQCRRELCEAFGIEETKP